MKPEQLRALYELCLDDAERRLKTMQQASKERNRAAFVAAAHAVKGGCGMVGATRLAAIAARCEQQGLPEVDDSAPFAEFLEATARLRGMLKAHVPR
jgi:HPt (histidine-containing phosphotransfer) domain-containing protein